MTPVHSVLALPAILLALTPFHSSAKPLPPPVQQQLKAGGFWHKGCPVPLSGLRLLTVSHRGFDGRTHSGQLIVNARAARPLARVFRKLHGLHFPIRHMQLADFYGPRRGRPRDGDVTASFECRQAVPSPCTGGKGTGTLVAARLRPRGRRQPAREPVRRMRAEPRPDGAALPRPLAPPRGDGDPAGGRGVPLGGGLGLGRRVGGEHQGLHALLGVRGLRSAADVLRMTRRLG